MSVEPELRESTGRWWKPMILPLGLSAAALLVVAGAVAYFLATFDPFRAIDYDREFPDETVRIGYIRSRLWGKVPSSAAEPHCYQSAGVDATLFCSFRLPVEEVDAFRADLSGGEDGAQWGRQLGDLPRPVPPEIGSWWEYGESGVHVLMEGRRTDPRGMAGMWWIVQRRSGKVLVVVFYS